jgi:hypothetical protein
MNYNMYFLKEKIMPLVAFNSLFRIQVDYNYAILINEDYFFGLI